MGTFSDRMTSTATRLLTKYGQSISFSRDTEGAYNPSTGETVGATVLSYTGYGHPSPYSTDEVDGTTILASDIRLVVNKTTQVPLIGDVAEVDGDSYRIMRVDKIKAQGNNIIYRLHLRV